MRISTWNVNGFRSCISNGFDSFLKTYNPDICCLQEIKLDSESIRLLDYKYQNYYYSYWHIGGKKGYSGVSIIAKKAFMPLDVKFGIDDEFIDSEGRVITAYYNDFVIVNAYFPHSHRKLTRLDIKLKFCEKLYEFLTKINKDIILTGDFNIAHQEIDLTNYKQNKKNAGFLEVERKFMDRFLNFGFADAFRFFNKEGGFYTWWGQHSNLRERNIGWRLDYFLITPNITKHLKSCEHLLQVYGSDHCPVIMDVEMEIQNTEPFAS